MAVWRVLGLQLLAGIEHAQIFHEPHQVIWREVISGALVEHWDQDLLQQNVVVLERLAVWVAFAAPIVGACGAPAVEDRVVADSYGKDVPTIVPSDLNTALNFECELVHAGQVGAYSGQPLAQTTL